MELYSLSHQNVDSLMQNYTLLAIKLGKKYLFFQYTDIYKVKI